MEFELHSHNFGLELIQRVHPSLWAELTEAITSISDDALRREFSKRGKTKSLSRDINGLLKSRLKRKKWKHESAIFNNPEYRRRGEKRWRLDFSKKDKNGIGVAVEVAFNHGEAIAWNLIKPVLSSQLNHVRKQIQTDIGVIIVATADLKRVGGFDSAVGTFEQFKRYLKPFSNILSVPLVLVGLKAPETVRIVHENSGNRVLGKIANT